MWVAPCTVVCMGTSIGIVALLVCLLFGIAAWAFNMLHWFWGCCGTFDATALQSRHCFAIAVFAVCFDELFLA